MIDKPTVVTAWAEWCAGPGWSNQPIWVLLRDANGKLSIDCVQPENQTSLQFSIFGISAEVHRAMVGAEVMRRATRKAVTK